MGVLLLSGMPLWGIPLLLLLSESDLLLADLVCIYVTHGTLKPLCVTRIQYGTLDNYVSTRFLLGVEFLTLFE